MYLNHKISYKIWEASLINKYDSLPSQKQHRKASFQRSLLIFECEDTANRVLMPHSLGQFYGWDANYEAEALNHPHELQARVIDAKVRKNWKNGTSYKYPYIYSRSGGD